MIGTLIGSLIRSELDAALGVIRYSHEAAARRSYRHASRRRTLTTSMDATTLRVRRARCSAPIWRGPIPVAFSER